MKKMFVDLLAMCEEFETRVRLLEAKADECQNKTKKVVDKHSKIWEDISKNLEKEVMAIEKPASLCERAEKLEENMNQFESRLKQLENRKSQSTVAGEVDFIEPLGEYEKIMNHQRADVEPMPFIFAQPVVLPSQSPTPVAPKQSQGLPGPSNVCLPPAASPFQPPYRWELWRWGPNGASHGCDRWGGFQGGGWERWNHLGWNPYVQPGKSNIITTSFFHINLQASIMIKEKKKNGCKDLPSTVNEDLSRPPSVPTPIRPSGISQTSWLGRSDRLGLSRKSNKTSVGKQYEVTYVGTDEQVRAIQNVNRRFIPSIFPKVGIAQQLVKNILEYRIHWWLHSKLQFLVWWHLGDMTKRQSDFQKYQ